MDLQFEELYWHDSIVKDIVIDKGTDRINDTICFEIDWYDVGLRKLLFENVYWARLELNFGIHGNDFIDYGYIAPEDDVDLLKVRSKWDPYINVKLYCFVIKTASTSSEIKIVARRFRIV
ncbi:hypothetical protein [Sphingobacterium sp.]|uniref:hypothetical protein n=1 Tax=Sphingobacterium sp. TaxID=341027 RepID=UPI002896D257|nr:hypothetical protein [Sphingobacterium sp.]